jgi:hypothetical protein
MSAADDRAPAASPAGAQPLPGTDEWWKANACTHEPYQWGVDVERASLQAEEIAEDEEPERGRATSAWEHHHG